MVAKAISPSDRYPNVRQLAKALTSTYGSPPDSRPLPVRTRVLLGLAGASLLVTVVFVANLVLQVVLNR
jgi:hypothetical protein